MKDLLLRCLPIALGLFCFYQTSFSQIRLFHTTRTNGIVREVDPNTGNILLSNIGGITGGRGMDISPLGGLFVCNNNDVSLVYDTGFPDSVLITYPAEVPHDLCFDATGNLYVVTNTNVHVYSSVLTPIVSFAHNLTTNTGDGNGNKGWGIEIRPDNGEIYITGAQGLRRHHPVTGALLGSIPNATPFGYPCLKFTTSGFTGAFLYMGATISGLDQIRVYDTNLNFLRTYWPPTHNGNPIDFEIHPVTQDLYLFNTVVSNPANRYNSSELLVPGYSTAANPSRGSAIGDINGVILPSINLDLSLQQENENLILSWQHQEESGAFQYVIEEETATGFSTVHQLLAPKATKKLAWQVPSFLGLGNGYQVRALDQNGSFIASDIAKLDTEQNLHLRLSRVPEEEAYQVDLTVPSNHQVEIAIYSLQGKLLDRITGPTPLKVDGKHWSKGILIYQLVIRDEKGKTLDRRRGKFHHY